MPDLENPKIMEEVWEELVASGASEEELNSIRDFPGTMASINLATVSKQIVQFANHWVMACEKARENLGKTFLKDDRRNTTTQELHLPGVTKLLQKKRLIPDWHA